MTNASKHLNRRRNRHQVGRVERRIGFARPLAVSSLVLALFASAASAQQPHATDGTITTVAGTSPGYAGDGGRADQAQVNQPTDIAVLDDGSVLIADRLNNRVRAVFPDGTIDTVFGTGQAAANCNDLGDGNSNSSDPSPLDGDIATPTGVVAEDGDITIISQGTNCLLRPVGQLLVRIAGASNGAPGLSGDGGPARQAAVNGPTDAATMPDGSLLIADTGNDRIRRVDTDGIITTFAGTTKGFAGDGGPASAAQLSSPQDLSVFPDGTVLVADTGNDRIRRITPDGIITTVAGGAGAGLAGDGDPATTAQLSAPTSVITLSNGGFLVADAGNDRVRRITPLGAIFTVAGTTDGLAGDGALAKNAQLSNPSAIAANPGGGFVVADTDNARVRTVSDVGAVPGAVLQRSLNLESVGGTVAVVPAGSTGALPLLEEDLVPLGSTIDARTGSALVNVRRTSGTLEPARAFDGLFSVSQTATDITDLSLTGPLGCPAGTRRSVASASAFGPVGDPLASITKKKRKKARFKRRLWVESKGKYRIKGRYVSALERGTKWRVRDACDRSEVRVDEGSVRVRNLVTGKKRIVTGPATFVVFAR